MSLARLRALAAGFSFWRWDNDDHLVVLGYQHPECERPAFELMISFISHLSGMRWNAYAIVFEDVTFLTVTSPRFAWTLSHANGGRASA